MRNFRLNQSFNFCSTFDRLIGKHSRLIYQRLELFNKQYAELSNLATNGQCSEIQRTLMNKLEPKINLYERYQTNLLILEDLDRILQQGDKEEKQFAQDEIQIEMQKFNQLKNEAINQLIPQDEYDDCMSTNVEIRPGVGGSESSLFAEDMVNMIQNYAILQGWNCKIVQLQKDTQIGKGCKFGVLQIYGEQSYYKLRCESGVHKVIRVPETESKGRLHSSTASIAVLPNIDNEFQLDEKELRFDFMRAQGAGGQHVNKTDSACRITHIPTGIQVVNQDGRSQDSNKQKALKTIKERLFSIHVSNQQSKMAIRRKEQVGSTDRSDKIRTYNYPQDRITDHRTNITLYGINKMLSGELVEQFTEAFLEKIQMSKLQDFLDDLEQAKLS